MLYTTVTPAQKRERFRELLAAPEIAQFPGAFTPLSTKLIQEQGFEGVYISGGVLANELGLPDEFIAHASRSQILADAGLTAQAIARDVIDQVVGTKVPQAKPARSRESAER